MRYASHFSIPLLAVLSFACADETDGLAPPPPQPPPPNCDVDLPTQIVFADVPGGASVTETHAFSVEHDERCTHEVEVEDPEDAFEVAVDAMTLVIVFRPRHVGSHDAVVTINKTEQVALSGNGIAPRITVEPTSLDFGGVAVGCYDSKTAELINQHDVPIALSAIRVQSPTDGFRVDPTAAVLPPNGRVPMSVRFDPVQEGTSVAQVGVEIDGFIPSVVPAANLGLLGDGLPGTLVTDDFQQRPTPKIDFLMIVSSAPSMGDAQSRLAESLPDLTRLVDSCPFDSHFAVTDADPSGLGGRFTSTGIVDSDDANFAARAQLALDVGTAGTANPQPFETMQRALTPPLSDGPNVAFRRPDAFLSVIVVSDREDRSPRTVQQYVDALEQITGSNAEDFGVSAVTGPCMTAESSAEAAPRLEAATELTNGAFTPICATRWWRPLVDGPDPCGSLIREVTLSRLPLEDSIRVTVEGIELPRMSAGGVLNWGYQAANNAVTFSPIGVPEWDQRFRITYTERCP